MTTLNNEIVCYIKEKLRTQKKIRKWVRVVDEFLMILYVLAGLKRSKESSDTKQFFLAENTLSRELAHSTFHGERGRSKRSLIPNQFLPDEYYRGLRNK